MAVRIGTLLLLFSALATGAPKDPKDGKFWKRVHGSIDRGVAWLLERQRFNGAFPGFDGAAGEFYAVGMHSLATFAVIKGGHPTDSKEVLKAMRALHDLWEKGYHQIKTYEVALVLMTIDAYYHATPPKRKRSRRRKKVRYDPKDLELARKAALWLQTKQMPRGMWRYPEGGMDLSNTQYAVLGLWSAHNLGIDVDRGVLRRCIEIVMERQQKSGPLVARIFRRVDPRSREESRSATFDRARGWRYMPEEWRVGKDGKRKRYTYPYSGSMTSAGIACLAICRHLLGKDDPWLRGKRDRDLRAGIYDGIAWIASHWNLEDNPGQPGNWQFYWLYGLERAANLLGLEFIGGRDWFHEGAERLMSDQRDDGSWPKKPRPRPKDDQNVHYWSDQVDTAFAILFLARATPNLKVPAPAITPSAD